MLKSLLSAALLLAAPFAATAETGKAQEPSWQGAYVQGSVTKSRVTGTAIGGWADWINYYYGPQKAKALAQPEGTTAAIRIGYDLQFGPAVFGLGAERLFGEIAGPFVDDPTSKARLRDTQLLFARAGVSVGNFLPYVLLGRTKAEGDYVGSFVSQQYTYTPKGSVEGRTFGVGAEYRWTRHISSHAEYRRTDFGKLEIFQNNAELVMDQYTIGLSYRF